MEALKKVLVVDDDPVVTSSFDRVLSGKGYAVIKAASGAEALRKLNAEHYDLVFTDIRMPGMSGIEVAERVKASQPWLPVVIVTGFGSEENEARATAAGVSAFLHKPLSPEMIEDSAEEALRVTEAKAAPAVAPVVTPIAPVTEPAPEREERQSRGFLANVVLFLASPFIGLGYLLALPFVGLGMIAMVVGKALAANPKAQRIGRLIKNAALFLASPFIGLAYILALPFVGVAMIATVAGKAIGAKYPKVAGAAKLVAAPFIGLAFIVLLPFVGLVAIARMVIKAAFKKPAVA
jgi:CheY-like chemotaxis protein